MRLRMLFREQLTNDYKLITRVQCGSKIMLCHLIRRGRHGA